MSLTSVDFDGDGYQDLVMGAPARNQNVNIRGKRQRIPLGGEVVVMFGKCTTFQSSEPLRRGFTGTKYRGLQRYQNLGHSLANAGDVNGDGYDDLIIGGYKVDAEKGDAYLTFGC